MDKLTELVSAKSAMPAEWIQPSTEIANLDIDSLDFVELIFEIESEFDIKIPTEWDGEFATMADLSSSHHQSETIKRKYRMLLPRR